MKSYTLLLAAALLFISLSLPAQDEDPFRAYRAEVLEVYLDRADLQQDREAWLDISEAGAAAAEAAWEKNALLLFESGAALQNARQSVQEAISREVQERFAEWLVERFLERRSLRTFDWLYSAVQEQNLSYLYITREGRIQRDASGDPLLQETSGLAEDRSRWRQPIEEAIGRALGEWRQGIDAALPELLVEIPESERDRLAGLVAGSTEAYREGYRRELDALFQQEEARFVALRSYDQYSLRRKSEQATAGEIADRLIGETREALSEGIRKLEAGLQEPAKTGAGGEVQIDSRRWLESFQAVFEAGLARWDRAEESLLVERVSWERQAGKDYRDGEQAWAAAYRTLQEERRSWEEQIRGVLAGGKAEWAKKEEQLAAAIAAAASELERESSRRAGSMSQRVESLVDMYCQASAMLGTAQDSGRYWLEKLNVKLPLTSALEDIETQAKPDPNIDLHQVLEQVAYWQDIWNTYNGYVQAARSELEQTYATIRCDDGTPDPLKGILEDGADPEAQYLDEYQVELLKARAVSRYWNEQHAIALAVEAYARDLSSNRATEAEGQAAYEAALAAYGQRNAAYARAIEELEAAGAVLNDRSRATAEAQEELAERRRELEQVQQQYSTQLAIYQSQNGAFFCGQLQAYYRGLLEALGIGSAAGGTDTLASVLADYLSAVRRYGFEQQIQLASGDLAFLVQGSQDLPSLGELRRQAGAITVPEAGRFPDTLESLGIGSESPYYSILSALFARYEQASDGPTRRYLAAECAVVAQKAHAEAEAALQAREQAIRLLSCADAAAWYQAATGEPLPADRSLGETLAQRADRAAGLFLRQRAQVEREALHRFQELSRERGTADPSQPEDFLAMALLRSPDPSLTGEVAASRLRSLDRLIAFLSDARLELSENREALRALAQGDPYLVGFIGGRGGILSEEGVDLASFTLADEWREREYAANLLDAYSRNALTAPGTRLQREAEGRAELQAALQEAGLLQSASAFSLKPPEAAGRLLRAMTPAEGERWLADALLELRSVEGSLAPYQAERLEAYIAELLRYAAVQAVQAGLAGAGPPEAAELQRDAVQSSLQDLSTLQREIGETADRIGMLARVAEKLGGSAEAAAAGLPPQALRDRLIDAGAVALARQALNAGAGNNGWGDAFESCFRGASPVLLELKEPIIARARELAGIQLTLNGSKALPELTEPERKAYAFALWKATDLKETTRVELSPYAEQLLGLWELLEQQVGQGMEPEQQLQEIESYRRSLSPQAASALEGVVQALAAGLREPAAIFLSALGGESLAGRIAEFRQWEDTGGAVFERALSLQLVQQLNGERGQAIFEWIAGLSGLRTYGPIQSRFYGSDAFDVEREAFLGLQDNSRAEDARLYYCRKLALAGEELSEPRTGLSEAGKAELDRFVSILYAARGYLSGVDPSEVAYALSLPRIDDANQASEYADAIRRGAWPDELFSSNLAIGGGSSTYLDFLWQCENGGGSALDRGILGALLDFASGHLAARAETLQVELQRLELVCPYRELYQGAAALKAGGEKNYRAYLLGSTLAAGDAESKPESAIAESVESADAGSILHREAASEQDWAIENELLEAYNEAARAGAELAAALAPDPAAEAAEREASSAFEARMARFTAAEDPATGWEPSDGYRISAETEQQYTLSRDLLGMTLSRLASFKAEIERLGAALELFNQDSSGTKALCDQQKIVESALDSYTAVRAAIDQGITELATLTGGYGGLYEAANRAYSELEEARLALRTQEQIQQYAGNGYLQAGEEAAAEGYRSPAAEVAYTLERKQRAQQVLEALAGIIGEETTERPGTDPSYLQAIEAYRQSYERFLALKKLQGELLAEISEQEGVVARQEAGLEQELGEIASVEGLVFLDQESSFEDLRARIGEELQALREKSPDDQRPFDLYLPKAASYFVRAVQGQGLRLLYDPGSYALAENNSADWQDLKGYLNGQEQTGESASGSTFQADLREWVQEMDQLLRNGGLGLLNRWGLAAGYVKQRLYESIGEGNADPLYAAMREVLRPDVPTESALEGQTIAAYSGQPKFQEITGWTEYIRQQGEKALAGMSEAERQCFEFYLALNLLSAAEDRKGSIAYGFFSDRSSIAVLEYFSSRLESEVTAHRQAATREAAAGAALYATGMALIWCGGWVLMIESAVLVGLAVADTITAGEYEEINRSGIEPALAEKTSSKTGVPASEAWFTAQTGTADAALRTLEEEQARLAAMKGGGGSKPSEEEFLVAIRQMTALKDGIDLNEVSLDPALTGCLRRYYDSVEAGDPAGLLLEIAEASEREKIASYGVLLEQAARALQKQDQRIAEYQQVAGAFLEGSGGVSPAALRAAAEAAFAGPLFTEKDHTQRLSELQQTLGLDNPPTDNESYESARRGVLGELKASLQELYSQRLSALNTVRQAEWALRAQELRQQQEEWQRQIGVLVTRGLAQWKSGTAELLAQKDLWERGFAEEYQRKSTAWDQAYLGFQEREKEWVEAAALKAAQVGSEQILREVGESAEFSARQASDRIVTGISYRAPEPGQVVRQLLGTETLAALLDGGRLLNRGIDTASMALHRGMRLEAGGAGTLSLVHAFQADNREELTRRGTMIVAMQARESLQEAQTGYRQMAVRANESFESGMDAMFGSASFSKTGRGYEREAIVGSTVLNGVLTEHQRAEGYRPFAVPSFEVSTDLSQAVLEELSAEGIQAKLASALKELESRREQVFGREGERNERSVDREDSTFTTQVQELVTELVRNSRNGTETWQTRTVTREVPQVRHILLSWAGGEFGEWIGYAPVFVKNPDAEKSKAQNILVEGLGELGHLMGDYTYFAIRQWAGYGEIALPVYDKPLWDDRAGLWGMDYEAPTLRQVVDVGVSIAALATGNVWLAAAVNLADETAFGLADVAGGYKSWGEAGVEFGKKALVGAATAGIGEWSSTVMGTMGGAYNAATHTVSQATGLYAIEGFGGVVARTAFSGVSALATEAVSAGINAIRYSDEAGWGWDSRLFAESLVGRQALAGYAGTMAGSLVSGSLGQWNQTDNNGKWLNAQTYPSSHVASFNSLMGGLASIGTQYAVAGGATINLLDVADFGLRDSAGNPVSMGLLELHLGGEQRPTLRLGTEGTALSLGTVARATLGLGEGLRLSEFKYGSPEERKVFDAINALGYTSNQANWAIGQGLFAGDIIAQFSSELASDEFGSYSALKAANTLVINDDLLSSDGALGAAKLATALSHEGTHYLRNRVEVIAHLAGLSAFSEIGSAWGLGDSGFAAEMIQAIYDPKNWKENTGSVDLWKLMSNGDLVSDGDGWLRDQNNNYINKDGSRTKTLDPQKAIGSKGIETGLIKILGLDVKKADDVRRAQEIMIEAGLIHTNESEPSAWMWGGAAADRPIFLGVAGASSMSLGEANTGKTISSNSLMSGFGDTVVAPVLMNGLDLLSDVAVFGNSDVVALAYAQVSAAAKARFAQFVAAKQDFYYGPHQLFDPWALATLNLSQLFQPSDKINPKTGKLYYPDLQHKGLDIAGPEGTPVYALFGGKVVDKLENTTDSGYSIVIEHGFDFEDSFYSTGVRSQFMHFNSSALLPIGNLVSGNTLLGYMGSTGLGDGGSHLHYQLMGDQASTNSDSSNWDMLANRRDNFLTRIGGKSTRNWSVQTTSSQNYWAPKSYFNFYYNPNELLRKMNIYVGNRK